MAEFPKVAEMNSRDVVPLFLRFISNEYGSSAKKSIPSQDIRKKELQQVNSDDIDDDNSPMLTDQSNHLDDSATTEQDKPGENKGGRRRPSTKSLCVHLTLFSLFNKPKALSEEVQIRQIYTELLSHKDSEVQKLAVKCLMKFKLPSVTPYNDNLERLLEDESFRDELALLTVEEGSVVDPAHREELMPIVIRLLYGKMNRWTGTGSSGKGGVGIRRSTVLRFIGHCPLAELKVFMDLVLAPFKHLYSNPNAISVSRDLSSVVPIRLQLGFLNMMQHISVTLGEAVDTFLPSLVQICLSLLSTCAFALEKREEVQTYYVSQLKQIRQLAILRLVDFFEEKPMHHYKFVCDTIFEAVVWPQINVLEHESIQSPTPLLRLLHVWTRYPRYFPLLSRKPLNSPDTSILNHVFKCLNASNVSQSVVTMVMEMTDNLLMVSDDDRNGESQDVMMELGSELSPMSSLESTMSYGTRLVVPHLSIIIHHLSQTVKAMSKSSNCKGTKKSSTLPKLELSVLSKISPFISDQENSTAFIKLLLPYISLRQREETEIDTLHTIKNLLSNVENPLGFTKQLSRLFSQFNARNSRQILCEVFTEIAKHESSYETIALIVTQMNSWNESKIDEPDYSKRMAGFAAAINQVVEKKEDLSDDKNSSQHREDSSQHLEDSSQRLEDSSPPDKSRQMDFVPPILHNCLYFVHRSDDLAIRDGAINCINSIIKRVARNKNKEEFDELILNSILPSCKLALRSKNETVRNEFIGILATMVRQFDHVTFEDMRVLLDDNPESDVFENIRHIQLHRRARALRKIENLCNKDTFKSSTLMAFLLPLATVYLSMPSDIRDNNLVSQAVNTIGAISSCLPWPKYSALLWLYLKKLKEEKEGQKIDSKVIVAVLNNFHFDLSLYNIKVDASETKEKPVQKHGTPPSKTTTEDSDTQKKQAVKKNEGDDVDHDDDDAELEDDGHDDDEKNKNKALDEKMAKQIYDKITTKILPQLSKSLTKKTQSYHKLSHTKQDDAQQALRVPIALAMVKLLKSLPQQTLHLHLPGLLLRVCITLKSQNGEVRDTARNVLCQIALFLGTKYFSFIIEEMRAILTRGYQLHVLGYTVHSLLFRMLPTLSAGDLDYAIPSLTEILVEDLFGEVAKEKDVEQLAKKLHEAKSSKSYKTLEILAQIVGSSSVSLLVAPLQQVLDSNQSHEMSRRVQEALTRIGVGLQANTELSTKTLMVFIHQIIHEKLPSITTKTETEKDETASEKSDREHETNSLRPANCYLLPPSPVRGGKMPGLSKKTNAHILVEFGLQILNSALKQGKISGTDHSHLQLLDPFVSVLTECMQTKHIKVLTLSLRCLCVMIKLPLPSLETSMPEIAKLLFQCLKKYARSGSKIGENYHMILSAFKAMTVIIQDFNKYTISEKHLQVLLAFVEEDIHDHTRRGTAFPLLKAILTRKLVVPEIHDVMKKVSQLSITGATFAVQQQCRKCVMQYMLDYSLGKNLQRLLEFYVSHLSYDFEPGRMSTLVMLTSIFNDFPESVIFSYASFFFLPLTTRLVNDESVKCRKSTAAAIKTLLKKLDVERRDTLFRMVTEWFSSEKVVLRRLAVQVCGQFVEAEGKAFDRRIPTTLPLMAEILKPKHYETEIRNRKPKSDTTFSNKGLDHLLFNALTTLAKLLQESKVIWEVQSKEDMHAIWVSVESHLLHPHAWIRLVSCRLLGLLFAAWKPEDLIKETVPEIPDYLAVNTKDKIAELCNIFILQMKSHFLESELSDQIIKNLVFISKLLNLYDKTNHLTQSEKDAAKPSGEENGKEFTLNSLFNKLEKLATNEGSQAPKRTQKRSCVMRWLAAVTTVLGQDDVIPYLSEVLKPIHRELDIRTTYKDPELQKLTQEVLEIVKGILGIEVVSRAYAELQINSRDTINKKRQKRKLEAVADPAQHARRKMKKNVLKNESKKRKLEDSYPERKFKKVRKVDKRK